MRTEIVEKVKVPEGISCDYNDGVLKCSKDSMVVEKRISAPRVLVSVKGGEVVLESKKANRSQKNIISTFIAHINNLFLGLQEKFVYKLEAANVHFPMTLKVEGDTLLVNNFLGEKVPRKAKILKNVEVEIKGQSITISSHDREAAGQTAANFEGAGRIIGRDKRTFQDGIYIIRKPGDKDE